MSRVTTCMPAAWNREHSMHAACGCCAGVYKGRGDCVQQEQDMIKAVRALGLFPL